MAEQNLVVKKILRGRPEGNTDTEYYNRTLEKPEGKNRIGRKKSRKISGKKNTIGLMHDRL
jgi:hypothetical protein